MEKWQCPKCGDLIVFSCEQLLTDGANLDICCNCWKKQSNHDTIQPKQEETIKETSE